MEPDRLFVETLHDLEERLTKLDEYGMLRAAGLLRQLLLDDQRLIDQVNQRFHLKIKFTVVDRRASMDMVIRDGAMFYSVEDGLDPEGGRGGLTTQLNRDQFLKWPVMFTNGHSVTIHELIDQLAHIEGGIHAGDPRTSKERALAEATRRFGIGGLPAGIKMNAAIGRVVLRAVSSLRDQLR